MGGRERVREREREREREGFLLGGGGGYHAFYCYMSKSTRGEFMQMLK